MSSKTMRDHFLVLALGFFSLIGTSAASAEKYFRAFIPGYVTNVGVDMDLSLPKTCEEWSITEQRAALAAFAINIRSNIPFRATIEVPAQRDAEGRCEPIISVNVGETRRDYPVSIEVLIEDELFVELSAESSPPNERFASFFDIQRLQCQSLPDGRWLTQTEIEQIDRATFGGEIRFRMFSAHDAGTCESDPDSPLCSCFNTGDSAPGTLASPVLPLITTALSPSGMGEAISKSVNDAIAKSLEDAALLESRCAREVEELMARGEPITLNDVSEECFDYANQGNANSFLYDR